MGAFLPSEVARLVLGYLDDQGCTTAYEEFLNQSPHLHECRGRGSFFTKMMGLSLDEILDDYCAIHSYVSGLKCSFEFKRKVARCHKLLDKVKFFIEKYTEKPENQNEKLSQSILSNRSISPRLNSSRLLPKRNNSCDSIYSIPTERSYKVHHKRISDERIDKCSAYLSTAKSPGNVITRSAVNLAEATNLADLPGNSPIRNSHNDTSKDKQMLLSQNSCHKSSPPRQDKERDSKIYQSETEDLNKTVVRVGCAQSGSSSVDKDKEKGETEFKKALGLIKHSDLDKTLPAKTPLKRKNPNTRVGLSARKYCPTTETAPSDSFDVTTMTMTKAFLDCTELHEKLAEQINKHYNSSLNKTLEVERLSKTPQSAKSEKFPEANKNFDDIYAIVAKSIVEKTEKDPLFDLMLNEVLAASVETTSGTESDVLSRPSTSTPEKSNHHSPNHNDSPPPSWKSHSIISPEQTRFTKDLNCRQQTNQLHKESDNLEPLNTFKPIHTPSPILPEPRIISRYPKGGKRMDILRASYRNSIGGDNVDGDVVSPETATEDPLVVPEEQASKPDKKIIILSNERVHTSILAETGSILIHKTAGNVDGNKKDSDLNINYENLPASSAANNSNKDPCANIPLMAPQVQTASVSPYNMIPISCTSLLSTQGTVVSNKSEKSNSSLPTDSSLFGLALNAVSGTNVASVAPLSETGQGISNQVACSGITAPSSSSTINKLKNFRRDFVTGRPPELVISNGRVRTCIPSNTDSFKDELLFTKEDILKMPTIIMLQPIENSNGTSHIQFPDLGVNSSVSIDDANNLTELIKASPAISNINTVADTGVNEQFNGHIQKFDNMSRDSKSCGFNAAPSQPTLPAVVDVSNIITKNVSYQTDNEALRSRIYGPLTISTNNNDIKTSSLKPIEINSEFLFPKRNTPDAAIKTRLCSSTPRRPNSHVRVLNFNTPQVEGFRGSRRVRTSSQPPFNFLNAAHEPDHSYVSLQSPISRRVNSKNIKSCLFKTVEEQQCESDGNSCLSVDEEQGQHPEAQMTKVWDQVQGVGHILANNETIQSTAPMDPSLPIIIDLDNYVETTKEVTIENCQPSKGVKKNMADGAAEWARIRNVEKKFWDQALRAHIQPLDYPMKSPRKIAKYPRKRKTAKRSNLIRKNAKRIEKALINKSNSSHSDSSASNNSNTKEVSNQDLTHEEPYATSVSVIDDKLTATNLLESNSQKEDVDSNLKSGPPSVGETLSNDSNRDHHFHLKSLRDLYSQQKSVIKSAESPKDDDNDSLVLKKPKAKTKSKAKTFKVKINRKNHTEDKHDSPDCNSSKSDKNTKSNKESKLAKSRQADGSSLSIAKSKSKAKVKKKIEKVEEITEIPESEIKVTPELSKAGNSITLMNAKCNLSSLFDTPFKSSILDMSMDTPKFLTPGDIASVSLLKALDFPTPKFMITPISMSCNRLGGKEHTPGSHSSRPTDYSGSSSYYKPDEIDDLYNDFENVPLSKRASDKCLKKQKISPEHLAERNESLPRRVLRPRPPPVVALTPTPKIKTLKTIKKAPVVNSSPIENAKEPIADNSPPIQGEPSSRQSRVQNDFFPNDNSSSGSSSCSECSSSCSSSSSSSDEEVSLVKNTKKAKTPLKSNTPFKQYITSTPFSKSFKKFDTSLEPVCNLEKTNKSLRDFATTRKMLEEKRLRVLSKLNSKVISPKKIIRCNGKKAVASKEKNNITRVPCKVKSTSGSSLSAMLESSADLKSNKLCTKDNSANLDKSQEKVLQPTPPFIKSRRKSSTPRKLQNVNFDSSDSLPQTFVKPNVKDTVDVNSDKKVTPNQLEMNKEESHITKKDHNQNRSPDISDDEKSNPPTEDEVFPSLHLSSDEADADMPKPSEVIVDFDEMAQIKEFIKLSQKNVSKSAFQINLEKEGHSPSAAKKIELLLISSTDDGDDSMEVELPVLSKSRVSQRPLQNIKSSPKFTNVERSKISGNLYRRSKTHYKPVRKEKYSPCKLKSSPLKKSMYSKQTDKSPKRVIKSRNELKVPKQDSPKTRTTHETKLYENKEESISELRNHQGCISEEDPEDLYYKETGVIIWGNYFCGPSSSNYHFYESKLTPKTRSKAPKSPLHDVDLSCFKMNVTLFDTACQKDVASTISSIDYCDLFEMNPDPLLRRRKLDKDRREKNKQSQSVAAINKSCTGLGSSNPLKVAIDEMSNSSGTSLSPIHNVNDGTDSRSSRLSRRQQNINRKEINKKSKPMSSDSKSYGSRTSSNPLKQVIEETSNSSGTSSPMHDANDGRDSRSPLLKQNIDGKENETLPQSSDNKSCVIQTSSNPEKQAINETSNSSETSTSPTLNNNDKTGSRSRKLLLENEIITAVSSISAPDSYDYIDLSSHFFSVVKENSDADPLSVENVNAEEDCNSTVSELNSKNEVVEKSENNDSPPDDPVDVVASSEGSLQGKLAEKRKREDDEDSSDSKRGKPLIPQNILKKISIESVLSQLHGPEL